MYTGGFFNFCRLLLSSNFHHSSSHPDQSSHQTHKRVSNIWVYLFEEDAVNGLALTSGQPSETADVGNGESGERTDFGGCQV
jgi:hypothetical protein